MLCRVLLTAIAISYLICVLFLSGIQKEDLDVTLLRKLERRNVNLDELNNENVRQECFKKFNVGHGTLTKNSTESTLNFDLASKGNITKASFADLLDTSELEILLQHLKKNKHKLPKFTSEQTGPISLNRTNTKKKNINVELKSFKYKIEIITKRPVVTEKVENDNRAKPTLSSVIKFWNMYMKSNPKSNKVYYNNEMTTTKVTPEPRRAVFSEEAESISKVIEDFVSNKGTNSDHISEKQKENHRFFNYPNSNGPYTNDKNPVINKHDVPKKPNVKNVLSEPSNFDTLHDLSFKGLLENINKLFSKPQTGNENKLTRNEFNTPNKPNKQDNVYEQRPQNEAGYIKHNENKDLLNNHPLNKNLNSLKSLLTNFQMNKFKNSGEILETITRLEQLGKDEDCPPLTTLPLKGNLSEDHKVLPSPLTGLLYDIMNGATKAPSMKNINNFDDNTEQYQKLLQQYKALLEKNTNYFEQNTEHYERFIHKYNAAPAQNIFYLEHPTELPHKFIQQFDIHPEKNENYSEQNTEQYQKIIQHYHAPQVNSMNYFEPNIEQPQQFIHHYSLPQKSDTMKNQTFVDDLPNNSNNNGKKLTPQRLPLKEIVFTTPGISTAINGNDKFLHPDVMKEIAENVKRLVLNDIQARILAITKPTITTEITTIKSISKEDTTSNVASINNQIIPNAIKLTATKLQPVFNTTVNTLNNSTRDEIDISSTADMFAASLTKIDSEKLKQATHIIEKFIELFKHIKLMQEIKSMAVTTTPDPPNNTTYKELMPMHPQLNFPVLMHPTGYDPPNSFNMKLQARSGPYDFLQEFQTKPDPYELLQQQSPLDLLLQARRRALNMHLQSVTPQQMLDINAQESKIPVSFEPGLHPPFPFNMKIQPPKILPIIINPYAQALQPLPFHNLNMNQPHVTNDTPNINKLNKSVTVHQTDVGAIVPIQMGSPVGLNSHIFLSSPLPQGLTQDEKNRWNIILKYGKNQAEIKDVESRKHTLNTYSNKPYHTENSSYELGSTLQNLTINNNVPLFKQDRKQYINDFRIDFNPERTSTATKQDPFPQIKNEVNISNFEQLKNENPRNSNFQDILAEVEKIAKVFGYKSRVEHKTKSLNEAVDNKEQNQNQNSSNNFKYENFGNTFEEKFHNKENPNIGIDYNSKLNPLDYRSKLDPRILHLDQMARILRANNKEEVFSNVFKRVYTPQNLKNIYTRRKSPDNNQENNYDDNVMVAMDSFKNKEYREKGISFDRRYNSGDGNTGKIPLGYHEKLERFEERSQYKDKDWQNRTPQSRPSAPIGNIKPLSNYNDAPFKNFLKTQQKVNKILERILATRTDDAARSTETI